MIRAVMYQLSKPVVWLLKPLKIFAYRTRFELLRRLILEFTCFIDWALIFINIQNETMILHQDIWGGDFVFGKAIMVTRHAEAATRITQPLQKSRLFMGVPIVANEAEVFASNSPMLQQNQPLRRHSREFINSQIFTERVRGLDLEGLRQLLAPILDEWAADPEMTNFLKIRGAATRIFVRILSDLTLPKQVADEVTFNYFRRFGELSALGYYFPTLAGILGSRERIRRDAYDRLTALGVDRMVVEMVLFAAMFSVGTHVMRVVSNARRYGLSYNECTPSERRAYIIESLRLNPTVTSTQRVLDHEEQVVVAGKTLTLRPGNEIAYPFICCHRDPTAFKEPDRFDIHRPQEEFDKVLAWSKGFHECPAKELSILVSQIMLDKLAERYDFNTLKIFQVLI